MEGMGLPNPMFFVGVVERNDDPRNEGRVRVRALGVHGTHEEIESQDLPWAICVAGDYDPNYPVPPLNAFVLGMFMDGRSAQHPIILGLIPSQYAEMMNPKRDGYGVISERGVDDPLGKGFRPDDFGLHQRSRYSRVEEFDRPPDELYFEPINTNRTRDQRVANSNETWDQPGTAYAAKYPYNRVIETTNHVIELDDTPGAERIMISHGGKNSGSFIQIDSAGTRTDKAVGDRYEVTGGTKHESSTHSVVTINGNAHVYVKGHKHEEIEGNYTLNVRGHYNLGVGKTLNMNSGGLFQSRSGGPMKIESHTDVITMFGKKEIQFEAEKQLNFVSQNIKNTALNSYDVYSNKSIKLTSVLDIHLVASNIINTASGLIPPTPLSGSTGLPGFSVNALACQFTSATGSFSGLWNAGSVNTTALLATTGQIGALTVPGATVANTITAFGISTAGLSAWAYTGPIGSGAPSGTAPVAPPAFPTLPTLLPAAISTPVALPIPGITSGWAYPTGNGKDAVKFATSVLTSPFDVLGIVNALTEGGYGIERIQMPEPPSEGEAPPGIVDGGYYAKGFSNGYLESDDSADKTNNWRKLITGLTNGL